MAVSLAKLTCGQEVAPHEGHHGEARASSWERWRYPIFCRNLEALSACRVMGVGAKQVLRCACKPEGSAGLTSVQPSSTFLSSELKSHPILLDGRQHDFSIPSAFLRSELKSHPILLDGCKHRPSVGIMIGAMTF
mmetsp:Transcript_59009/g.109054  ORF Transcript_59009/g.109054 Transcript_59009/m.109054 type:complete len:135 (-) Transcript_59009:326-730(-)